MSIRSNELFSVVIPTCNEGELLHQTVDSILEQSHYPGLEVIVVDDGSTDGSCDRHRDADGPVKVLTSTNLGVARARNHGAQHAAGEYVVFIDAHCKVSPGWIGFFADALSPLDVGLVGPAFTRLEEPEPRGCGMTWIDYTLGTSWFEPLDVNEPYEVPLTTGACQGFRKATFEKIGRYDETFTRWGFEDIEICLRAWLLGYRVLGDPRITVAHHFRESRDYEVNDADIMFNFIRMIYTHFSRERIDRVLEAISPNPLLQQAMDALYESDVFQIRGEMDFARVRDDDWFFNVFMPHI